MMPTWFWSREQIEGRVVQLLPNYALPDQTIHALTSSRHRGAGKVRRFIDHVEKVLRSLNGPR